VVVAPPSSRVAVGSTRSGERARRARGHTARNAPLGLQRASGLLLDSRFHRSTPPSRAPAPPRSSTARVVSEGRDLVSRSCPLRTFCSVLPVPAGGPAAAGLRGCPAASWRRRGWLAGALRAAAPRHSTNSTPPPRRTDRRRRAPARTLDIARIDRPRAAAPARRAGRAPRLAARSHAAARVHAPAAKARVARPGPSPSPSPCSTSSAPTRPSRPRGRAHAMCAPHHRLSTSGHRFSVSPPRPPLDPPAPVRAARVTCSVATTTALIYFSDFGEDNALDVVAAGTDDDDIDGSG
jgi:hypothetical protein